MSAPNGDKPAWYEPNGAGWFKEGIHTPMRRCGSCKCDLSMLERERGLCRACATVFDDKRRQAQRVHELAQREDAENAAPRPQPLTAPIAAGFTEEPNDETDDEDDFDRAQRSISQGLR